MKFEFDPVKSANNKIKHGLDFLEAQKLWENDRVEIPAKTEGERRYAQLGKIDGVHHTVIITYRGTSNRIISARRSSEKEKAIYEQHTK